MFQNFIVLILFLLFIRIVNKKLEKYIGYPIYTKMHDYIKDSKVLLYKKMSINPYVRNYKKKLLGERKKQFFIKPLLSNV